MSKIKLTPHIRGQVEDRHIALRSGGRIVDSSYEVSVLPESHACKTGCWTFDTVENKHRIMISPMAYDTIATPSLGAGVRKDVAGLFKGVYEHEAAHSKFTTKDLKGLNEKLRAEKIPWRLFNLFEDVRIEHLWSRYIKKFGWMKWESFPMDVSKITPSALLYWCKTTPHGRYGRLPQKFHVHFRVLPFYSKVVDYYYKILGRHTSEELIPLIKAWLVDFPKTSDDSIEAVGGLGTGDLKDAMAIAGETVSDVKQGDRGPKSEGKPEEEFKSAEGESGTLKAEVGPGGGLGVASGLDSELHDTELPRSKTEAKEVRWAVQLARMLDTAFKGTGLTKAPTARPSKKLNLRAILRKCYDLPYIGKVIGNRGAPHISLLIDCSGSMRSAPCYIDRDRRHSIRSDDAGRILLRALSILARKGRITGEVYLCASGGVNWRGTLPLRNQIDFTRFVGFSSSEGFGMALRPDRVGRAQNCFREVSRHKLAICYTDGCITDRKPDRVALRERGVHTLGVCCGASDRTTQLKEHFDTPISRESLWGLADALVRFLRGSTF